MTNKAMQEQDTLHMEVKWKPKSTETEPIIVDQMGETRDTTREQRTKRESVRGKQQMKVVLAKRISESASRLGKRLVVGSAAKFCEQVAQCSIPSVLLFQGREKRERNIEIEIERERER